MSNRKQPPCNRGFHAIVGNPPWILYAGKGSQPIDAREEAFLKAVHGRAAKTLSTHGLFTAVAAQLAAPGGRIGLILPTSVADAERYAEVRAAHDTLCEPESDLPDFGEDAFQGVFQPSMALISTRRDAAAEHAHGAPWKLARADSEPHVRRILAALNALPKLPSTLFGERGYRSSAADKGKFVKATSPRGPYTTPLYEGTSVREFELLPPTAYGDPARLPDLTRADKWSTVDVFIRQTAKYPIAAPSARAPFRNSVLAGFAQPPYTAGFLLAYLNSTPVRWFHFHSQRDAQQGMPQVKVGHLRALPAPDPAFVQRLSTLGDGLAARNCGITDSERTELDAVVAAALHLATADLAPILDWGRKNPPPAAKHPAPAKPGLRKTLSSASAQGTEDAALDRHSERRAVLRKSRLSTSS